MPEGELILPFDQPYSVTFTGQYGIPPYHFSAVGLPLGIHINPATGTVSGTATVPGGYGITVTVTDTESPAQLSQAGISVYVRYPPIKVAPVTLSEATVGVAYPDVTLTATGGSGQYTWGTSADTYLPAGMHISWNGVLSGTPEKAGTYPISLQVTDFNPETHIVVVPLTLVINPAPA